MTTSCSTVYGTSDLSISFRIISINTNLFLKNASFEERAQGEVQIAWLETVLLASTVDSTKAKVSTNI